MKNQKKKTDKPSSKTILKHILLMCLISLIIVLILSFSLSIFTRHGKTYDAPEMTGYSIDELKLLQKKYDFDFVVTDSMYVKDKKPGTILKQNPLPGEKIKKGRKFYLQMVSLSPENVVVPAIVGNSLRQISPTLEALGFEIGNIAYRDDISNNIVLGATCKGKSLVVNSELPKGSVIDLVVSKNNESDTQY
jgi:beta-lactam-binding protein with PASTA domain